MRQYTRQIIALGGGGFSDNDTPGLDQYILAQARQDNPRVCFIPTASGDSERYLVNFYSTFVQYTCRPSHLPFFSRTPSLETFILNQDVIYVGGGNTWSMLAVWQAWGLDAILRQAWKAGIVLAGISAGAICWFEQGITDSRAGYLSSMDCLGLLPGSCCPHYSHEPERRPAYHRLLHQGEVKPGYALDDYAALHFHDTQVHQAVSSRAAAQTYHVDVNQEQVNETPLPTLFLGAS